MLTHQTPGGHAPVDEYSAGLEGTAATKAAALVKLLEALGYELRLPHSRSLGDGLQQPAEYWLGYSQRLTVAGSLLLQTDKERRNGESLDGCRAFQHGRRDRSTPR